MVFLRQPSKLLKTKIFPPKDSLPIICNERVEDEYMNQGDLFWDAPYFGQMLMITLYFFSVLPQQRVCHTILFFQKDSFLKTVLLEHDG